MTRNYRLIGATAISISTLAILTVAATAQDMSVFERPSKAFYDVTVSHMPQAPTLHALEAAFADVDGDGDLDAAIAVEYGANRLYLNDGKGKFSWNEGAFGAARHDNEHVRTADFNGDGNADFIFVAEADEAHQLFLGDGNGKFVDASDRLPLRSQGNALAVGDVNGDGLPDIVVGNTGEKGNSLVPARNFLWLADKKRPGYFIDVTRTHLPDNDDQSEGVELADMDGDGDLDLLVASATRTNRLLFNDGKGRFRDASDRLELKVPMETRGVHAFDANGDGKKDILYFNLTSNNKKWDKDPQTRLLINDGQGRWRDRTEQLPAHSFSSWGGAIADLNGDGAPDIIVGAIQVPGFVPLQVRAWLNDGTGKFSDATLDYIPALTVGRSWKISVGDLDGEAKPDLLIGGWGTQARLLLSNLAEARKSWPRVEPLSPPTKR